MVKQGGRRGEGGRNAGMGVLATTQQRSHSTNVQALKLNPLTNCAWCSHYKKCVEGGGLVVKCMPIFFFASPSPCVLTSKRRMTLLQ